MRRYGTPSLLLAVSFWLLYVALAAWLPSHPHAGRVLLGIIGAAGTMTVVWVVIQAVRCIESALQRRDSHSRARTLAVLDQVDMRDAS